MIKPECLVSMLLCARMEANETIVISGPEQFSAYTGYGSRFAFTGDILDGTERAEDGSLRFSFSFFFSLSFFSPSHHRTHVVAIDAIVNQGMSQFRPELIKRDIFKCYAGLYR